jgi:hypothetical protein
MIATVAILLTPLLIALLLGAAVGGLLDPRGRWVTFESVPLGVGATIALLYAVGYLVPIDVATFVVVAAGLVGLGGAVLLRRRPAAAAAGGPGLRGTLPGRTDLAVIGSGLLGALLLLVPTLRLGFPTAIAATNNDGWAYAGFVNWLSSHSLSDEAVPSLTRPLDNVAYFQLKDGFGCGFEMVATMAATLLGRDPYEVVGPVSAFGAVVAVCGWLVLWRALRLGLTWWLAPIGLLIALSPLAVMTFSQNFAPHFFSLCLVPFAVGATLRYMEAPRPRTVVPAVLGILAVVGVYPAVIPWLAMAVAAVVLLVLLRGRDAAAAAGWWRFAGRRVALPLGLLVALSVAAGPYQARQTWLFATIHDDNSGSGNFPRFGGLGYPATGLGTVDYIDLVEGDALGWARAVATVLVILALTVAVVVALHRPGAPRTLVALMTAVALATAVVFGRFAGLEQQGYGMFKSIVSGGTLFSALGMTLLLVAAVGTRSRWALVAVVAWATVWAGVGADHLERSWAGGSGFRAPDVEMGRALAALPAGSSVLAGGAGEEPGSFQLRMMTGYFGTAGDSTLRMQGLGTSSSYIAPGGQPEAVPTEPWRYVVETAGVPSPVVTDRRPVFRNAGYTVAEAPTLDLTRFGSAWLPGAADAAGGFAWISGPVSVVVSNRGSAARRARVSMRLQAARDPEPVRLTAGRTAVAARIPADRPVPLGIPVVVPAGGTRVVTLDVRAGGVGEQVLRVQGLDVRALPAAR